MMRLKWPVCVLSAVLVLSLVTACKKRGSTADTSPGRILPVADTKDESGWPLYQVSEEGFALALPPDWRHFDMNPKTFEATFKAMLKQNPQLEPMLGNLRQQVLAGVKFFGLDAATINTGTTTNVNVVRAPLPPGTTLDTVVAETARQFESLATVTKPIVHERLKMTSGDRERFRFKITIRRPDGQNVTVAMTQDHLVKNNDNFVVTLTTLADQEANYAPIFEKIGQSFRFTK